MAVVWADLARRFVELARRGRRAATSSRRGRRPRSGSTAATESTERPAIDEPAPAVPRAGALRIARRPRVAEDLRTAGSGRRTGSPTPGAEPVLAALSRTGRPDLAVAGLAGVVEALRDRSRSTDPAAELLRALRTSVGFRGRLLGVLGGSATLGRPSGRAPGTVVAAARRPGRPPGG